MYCIVNKTNQSVIDIEKEGIVLFCEALKGATQKSWRIYFQFVVPPLGGLS